MINYEHILGNPYKIFLKIIGGSGSGKANVLLNIITKIKNQILTKLTYIYILKIHLNQSMNY